MARWNEAEFVQRAGRIAHDHAVAKTSLNDLSEKMARDENLQPDEIRTLVRLANVATFQELFKGRDASNGGDKMIEFEAGDPEAVIHRIVESANQAPQSANITNDKLASAWDAPDLMRETRFGHAFDAPVQEKTATVVEDSPRPMRHDLAVLALRKLAEEFQVEQYSAGQRWEAQLNKLAAEFRKAPGYGPVFLDFEKDAYADHGMAALPEITGLRDTLKLASVNPDPVKVAALQERHVTDETPSLRMLKEAMAIRDDYEKFTAGLNWINQHMKGLGA
jgi:uncharacterized protein YqfB (UPF0267 family)